MVHGARVSGKPSGEHVLNVLARSVERLSTPAPAGGEVRQIEPPAHRETGRDPEHADAVAEQPAAAAAGGGRAREIAAVAPQPHSFGRRR